MAGVIVHEWISRTGGSEKVLDEMVEAFPDADVVTLWNDDVERRYPGRRVHETWIARTPLRRVKPLALPLMIPTWRRLADHDYEWALVSSHLFAHHARFVGAPELRKYLYVHTPARYIWNPELDPRGQRLLPRLVSPALRSLDYRRAQEASGIAANSAFVQARIAQEWHRGSTVIYPPVQVERLTAVEDWREGLTGEELALLESLPAEFLLGASRFVPYKRLDLVIEAGQAAGVPVVLAGGGPIRARLVEQAENASIPVHIVDQPSDGLLYALYQAAAAYVFPAIEDFGIMPVEAMALGTPVVTRSAGGGTETVLDGVSGAHIHEENAAGLAKAVERALECSPQACRDRADDFSVARFQRELRAWLQREHMV